MASARCQTRATLSLPGTVSFFAGGLLLMIISLGLLATVPNAIFKRQSVWPSALALLTWNLQLTAEGRVLELLLLNAGLQPLKIERLLVDGREVLTWEVQPTGAITPGGEALLRVRFPFRSETTYRLMLEDDQRRRLAVRIETPLISAMLKVERLQATLDRSRFELIFKLAFQATGYNELVLLAEPLIEFHSKKPPIWLFVDSLSEEARAYVEALQSWATRLDPPLDVRSIGWADLAQLQKRQEPGVLVVFTPLQGHRGPVTDALPSVLLEPNLARLQAWLRAGLVLVTPTSTHPLRRVLRPDGRMEVLPAQGPGVSLLGTLSTWWSVTAQSTHESAAARALLWGRYRGEYGGAAELAPKLYGYQEASKMFTTGPPEIRGRTLKLYNPFFLRAGQGGWLALAHNPPPPSVLGHDLALLLVHAPWRFRELAPLNPGYAELFNPRGGQLALERHVTIELSPNIAEPRVLRLLILAEDSDRGRLNRYEQEIPIAIR